MVSKRKQNLTFFSKIATSIEKVPGWLWLILVITFILRFPSFFEPYRYADEDIYFTLGMAMRRGLNFYRDIHDNKPPLIYILAGLAGTVFWFRLFLAIWHSFSIFLFYLLARALFPKKRGWILVFATFVFSLLTTVPTFEGNISNAEIFMILPATAGAYLLFVNRKKTKGASFFWAGILFSIAFLFKVPIGFDLAGIMFFLWFFKGKSPFDKKSWKERLKFLVCPAPWLTLFGFLLPTGIVTIYYAAIGAFKPFFYSALFQNIGYLSSWEGGGSIWQSGLFQRGVVVFLIIAFLFFFKKRFSSQSLFVSCWFLFSLFGALLSGRPYPHYLIEVAPSFVLVLGFLLISKDFFQRMVLASIAGLAFISFFYFKFWYYKTIPYYQNFLEYTFGKKSEQEYLGFFSPASRNYKTAFFIKERTMRNDEIFVWGTQPSIYVIAARLPVGRYTVSYHIADFNAFSETIETIDEKKPKFIVKMTDEPKRFPALDSFLSRNYILVKTIEEAEIYKKINGI